jgi:hypothetical protein
MSDFRFRKAVLFSFFIVEHYAMDIVLDLSSLEYLTPVFRVTGDTALIHYALDPSHRVPNRYVLFITGFWKARQAVLYRQEIAGIAARNKETQFLCVGYFGKITLSDNFFRSPPILSPLCAKGTC